MVSWSALFKPEGVNALSKLVIEWFNITRMFWLANQVKPKVLVVPLRELVVVLGNAVFQSEAS